MTNKETAKRREKVKAVAMTTLAAVAAVAIIFLMFCLTELFINVFTGGWFSWVFPCVATSMLILALLAIAMIGGGDYE